MDWTDTSRDQIGAVAAGVEATEKRQVDGGGRVVRTSALALWSVLEQAWTALEFDVVADEAFRAVVLARIVEPISKADTPRVLDEIGVAGPSLRTIFRALGRCVERDYRGLLAAACLRHCTRSGPLSLVLYDVTTLHFETDVEDRLRKVGMSKERRVDPQVTVGLLTTGPGSRWMCTCSKATRPRPRPWSRC